MSDKVALDLFSGTGSATKAFRESDEWEVVGVDLDPDDDDRINPDIKADILDLSPKYLPNPDFIWASPPCPAFSLASVKKGEGLRHFNKKEVGGRYIYMPKTEKAVRSVRLVYHTLYLIENLDPDYWFMENPRGLLRSIIGKPPGFVTYCQYGESYRKPTDLWGDHPDSFEYRTCKNGEDCHESASRGSRKGVTGKYRDPVLRSKVPHGLSEAILEAVENPNGTRQVRVSEL